MNDSVCGRSSSRCARIGIDTACAQTYNPTFTAPKWWNGRHARLRGVWGNPCGFKSRLRHHILLVVGFSDEKTVYSLGVNVRERIYSRRLYPRMFSFRLATHSDMGSVAESRKRASLSDERLAPFRFCLRGRSRRCREGETMLTKPVMPVFDTARSRVQRGRTPPATGW